MRSFISIFATLLFLFLSLQNEQGSMHAQGKAGVDNHLAMLRELSCLFFTAKPLVLQARTHATNFFFSPPFLVSNFTNTPSRQQGGWAQSTYRVACRYKGGELTQLRDTYVSKVHQYRYKFFQKKLRRTRKRPVFSQLIGRKRVAFSYQPF